MQKTVQEVVNKQLLRRKPTGDEFAAFTEALRNLKDSIQPNESEEHNKTFVAAFLRDAFYGKTNLVNTAHKVDCAIYQTTSSNSPVEVFLEVKAPGNQSEFPSFRNNVHNLNCKAMQELVRYFMEECYNNGKQTILKHLIMTNGYQWYIIDANEFKKYFAENKEFRNEYEHWADKTYLFNKTIDFDSLSKARIDQVKHDIEFVYIDIRSLKNENDKLKLYRILQPAHLLRRVQFVDSNKLNTAFYNELLHIIGLEEYKVNGKPVIDRKEYDNRDEYSLLENTIYQLQDYNLSTDDTFDVALNLVITWVNRVLFLKLLESQLISYHGQKEADQYRFLDINRIRNFDELNELFFKVLALPAEQRPSQVKDKFTNVPYLNSSLFELTTNENTYFRITGIKPGAMPLYNRTVLRDINGHPMQMQMDTLEYLFRFLEAYDFGSEQSDDITQTESRTLINASVLGLIFEKINGYKDGSFFTPGFITQYMCHEAIERTIIQKFNEHFNFSCKTITDIHNQNFDKAEAISLLDSITICDPAVGSGHFLVSALNNLIAVRAELDLLYDENGKRLKDYSCTIDNDELIVFDEDGEIFHYNPNNPERQRVQKTLFDLKRRIIENNLFGADINPNSVNICRLRLWIELLKNAYYKNSQDLETLPNIDINIKCGDSLRNQYPISLGESINNIFLQKYVSAYKEAVILYKQTSDKTQKQNIKCSIDALKYRMQHSDVQTELFTASTIQNEFQYEHPLEWMIEYPEVLDDEGKFLGFDIVIGNPPYIQLQADGGKLAKLYAPVKNKKTKEDSRNNFKTYAATGDIYCLFYERGMQLLKSNGILCYITSNKWTLADYGEKLRQLISSQTTPHIFIDFTGIKIFENATVDTNILLLSKKCNVDPLCTAVSCENHKIEDLLKLGDFVKAHHTDTYFTNSSNWIILSEIERSIKRKIESLGKPLKDWDIDINYGIKTGCNDAFIVSSSQRENLLQKCKSAEELKRTKNLMWPILRGRDIKRYGYNWANIWLIYIPWHFPLHKDSSIQGASINAEEAFREAYPTIYEHLLSYKNALSERNKSETGIRYEWYAMQRWGANYADDFFKPKIVYGQFQDGAEYSFAESGVFLSSNEYMLITRNYSPKTLLAFLNSKTSEWLLGNITGTLGGHAKIGQKSNFLKMSIAKLPEADQMEFDLIVDEILAKKKQQQETSDLEELIDRKIYEIYNFTEQEIREIESKCLSKR